MQHEKAATADSRLEELIAPGPKSSTQLAAHLGYGVADLFVEMLGSAELLERRGDGGSRVRIAPKAK